MIRAPEAFAEGCDLHDGPFVLIDLGATSRKALQSPPCPVIAVGESTHPLAAHADVVVPDFAAAQVIAESIAAQPHAAAVLVQLLRLLPQISVQHGLVAESLAYAALQGSAAHRAWQNTRARAAQSLAAGAVDLSRQDDVFSITLDRPEAGNAIDRPMRDGLFEGLALANADPEIARVVLRGRGKAFSLGADLDEFGTTTDPAAAHAIRGLTLPAHQAALCMDRLEAEIDGACVGSGLELAGFSHRITATARSWFQLPELAMGIIPGAGGCVSLSRRIGRQRTAWMVLSGRRISARQALEWGLIDAVVDELP